ncbi:MAG TPA: PQQ-dependent sugar dehydrogenase [Chloroflexia bacterium]|nr:PQQ-dependent sugar dehydrogenase [Chloroflexia bacterium]
MRFSRKPLTRIATTLVLVAATMLAVLPGSAALSAPAAQDDGTEGLPPGVRVETVLSDMDRPIAMAFDPAGRLFYTEKVTGNVRLFAGGKLQPNPVIHFDVSTNSERGLLGIAIDPNFNQNRFIYIYHTAPGSNTENRVVRFVERDGVGSNPTVIFASPQTAGNHDGGNLHFGPDGMLYVSVGDNANADNAQDLTTKNGKIHRLNPDGSIPADNPSWNVPGAVGSIYAYGLRNSFDFTFDPVVRGRIFASENGPGCDDEMNRIERGFNYGWRANYPCDDANPPDDVNTIPPLWYQARSACCEAPTGIEVYDGWQIPEWRNHLFMAAYQGGKLRHFYLNEDRTDVTRTNIVQGVDVNMDIETGPDGALYFMEGGGYSPGTLKRFVGPGQPPTTNTPVVTPAPTSVPGGNPSIPGSGSRTFPETRQTVTGIFLDYWDKNGGLPQQGFPISGLINEVSDLNGKPYVVQYFERAVFEYHPENQAPYNVLLSQLGTFQYRKKYPDGAPGQQPNTSAGSMMFPETGKRVGGRFLQYWQQNGGLPQQGYPISDEFMEKSDLDGKTYRVQYFERAVFELHPENQPPFDVLLSQLGKFRYDEKYGGR